MEKHCLLTCSSWLAYLVFLYVWDCLSVGDIAHYGLDPPTLIINQENSPIGLSTG